MDFLPSVPTIMWIDEAIREYGTPELLVTSLGASELLQKKHLKCVV